MHLLANVESRASKVKLIFMEISKTTSPEANEFKEILSHRLKQASMTQTHTIPEQHGDESRVHFQGGGWGKRR